MRVLQSAVGSGAGRSALHQSVCVSGSANVSLRWGSQGTAFRQSRVTQGISGSNLPREA